MKKSSRFIIITFWILCSAAQADEHFTFIGGFNGTAPDDGAHDGEIALVLFHGIYFNIACLTEAQKRADPNSIEAAEVFLLNGMLKVRAFCEQRATRITLTPSQKKQLEVVQRTLAQFKIGYHQNSMQDVAQFCARSGDQVLKALDIMSIDSAFQAPDPI